MGLTENIVVYVRPLGGVPSRAPGKCLTTASGKKKPQKSLQESSGQPLAEQLRGHRVRNVPQDSHCR